MLKVLKIISQRKLPKLKGRTHHEQILRAFLLNEKIAADRGQKFSVKENIFSEFRLDCEHLSLGVSHLLFTMMKTYESLESMLKEVFPQNSSIEFKELDTSGASGIGSQPKLAQVQLRDGRILHLFLKICYKDSAPFKFTEIAFTMAKEVGFYEKILPEMVAFQAKHGIREGDARFIGDLVPKYYASGVLANGDLVMIMEDVINLKFKAVGRKDLHSKAQVRECLKLLALFHAVGFAMKTDFERTEIPLKDYIYAKEFKDTFGTFHLGSHETYLKILKAILDERASERVKGKIEEFCDAKDVERLQKITPKVYDLLRKCRSTKVQ